MVFEEKDPTKLLDAFAHNFAVLKSMTVCQPFFSNMEDFIREVNAIHKVAFKIGDVMMKIHDIRMTVQSAHITPEACLGQAEDKDIHTMFRFFCETAGKLRLRRTKAGAIYAPVIIGDGKFTHCYEYISDVEDWIWSCVTPELAHPLEWSKLIGKTGLDTRIISLLKITPDPTFPWLEKQKNLFSCDDGVFDILECEFYYYDVTKKKNINLLPQGFVTSNYIPGKFNRAWLPSASHKKECKRVKKERDKLREEYIDNGGILPMNPEEKWYLPPEAQRLVNIVKRMHIYEIFRPQDYDDNELFKCLACLGRALHTVKTDKFEIIPFFRGPGGTGKSTLLNLLMAMLDPVEVGFLMGDGQVTFTDEHLINARLVVFMDVEKSNIIRTRLTSYASGETVLINRKHKTPISKMWDAPIVMASNGQPPWEDQSGNLVRRFVIWLFQKAVIKADTNLPDKCKSQLLEFLVVISLMYRLLREMVGKQSIWEKDADGFPFLPKCVLEAKKAYLVSCNACAGFFEGCPEVHTKIDDSSITKHNTVPMKDLNNKVMKFQQSKGVKNPRALDPIEDLPMLTVYGVEITGTGGMRQKTATGIVIDM